MQLIFVVESNKESKSDYFYISETVKKYYNFSGHKLTDIYMDGKGKYNKKEHEIRKSISKYKGESKVFICYDIDNPNNPAYIINSNIEKYAKSNNYDLIWFYEDVESVYLKTPIPNSEKTQAAKKFVSLNKIENVKENDLVQKEISKKNSSNILSVLDKYLSRK